MAKNLTREAEKFLAAGARWFYHLPRWLTALVHNLTGYGVHRMTITGRDGAGRVVRTQTRYYWSKARRTGERHAD